jgi:hypothetical protein
VNVKPEREDGESPVEYFNRTMCCPDDYYEPHDGLYYCNPAHCSRTFTDKADRDKHLDWAYSILG